MDYFRELCPCQGQPVGFVHYAYVIAVEMNLYANEFSDGEGAGFVITG